MIVAPNHFSFMDHFFVAVYLRRKVQFMAKSQLFKMPLEIVYHNGGVFPVRRGHRDEEAFKTAHAVLARGGIVVMYCEGGRSRTGELGEPKPGIGRLALESGAPVVPVALVGSERVRDWKRLQFPKVVGAVRRADPLRAGRRPLARAVAGRFGADLRPHPRPVAGAARERPRRDREGGPGRPPRRRGGRSPPRKLVADGSPL